MGVGKYAALCKRMYIFIIGNQLTQNNDRHFPEALKCKKKKKKKKNVKKKNIRNNNQKKYEKCQKKNEKCQKK